VFRGNDRGVLRSGSLFCWLCCSWRHSCRIQL
jgi:hypothetical protein